MSIKITKDKNAIIAVILYGLYGLFDFFAGTKDIVEISNSTWVLVLRLLLCSAFCFATVYKGNIIKNLIMDCQSYTKYRPNETTGGIFVSWRRKEELPTGA